MAGMAAEAIVELIANSGGVIGAVDTVIDSFNNWFGGVNDVKDKTRWLQISVVNLSTTQTMIMNDSWFDSGRFWSQPFASLKPGSAQTFFVCNKDGSIFTGVSGGVGYNVYNADGSTFKEGDKEWWISTFSNPYVGSTKCLTRFKDYGIRPLFDQMDKDEIVRDKRWGCYKHDDKTLMFIWKDEASPW